MFHCIICEIIRFIWVISSCASYKYISCNVKPLTLNIPKLLVYVAVPVGLLYVPPVR
jgi:hypothetical protein